MKVLAVLAVVIAAVHCQVEIPAGAFTAVRNAGIQTISDQIKATNKKLTDAVEAFKPINATCNRLLNKAIPKCRSCVQSKCEARAKKVCDPAEWQKVLAKTIGFFKDGIPNFFSGTIPDVFVNKIGGGIVDVGKNIGGFFKDTIGGGLENFGKNIGSGVVDIGKGAVGGIVDIGKKIGSGVVDIGKTIGSGVGTAIDGIKSVGNKIKDFGSSIGKAFGGLFGKREETFMRTRRQGEPSCGDFEKDSETACKFYLSSRYCPDCGFDSNKVCSGYKAATDKIKAANTGRQWMVGIKKQNYDIIKMTFNPAAMAANGGFKNVFVKMNLFGKDLQFNVKEAINPYIPNVAGPIIARQAVEEYKKA